MPTYQALRGFHTLVSWAPRTSHQHHRKLLQFLRLKYRNALFNSTPISKHNLAIWNEYTVMRALLLLVSWVLPLNKCAKHTSVLHRQWSDICHEPHYTYAAVRINGRPVISGTWERWNSFASISVDLVSDMFSKRGVIEKFLTTKGAGLTKLDARAHKRSGVGADNLWSICKGGTPQCSAWHLPSASAGASQVEGIIYKKLAQPKI